MNTKKVDGRRQVRYASLEELLAEAEQLAKSDVRMLGNWSRGQIYGHLARTMNASIDGFDYSMPAPVRFVLTLMMKRKFLQKGLPAGFKSSEEFIPTETASEAGLVELRDSIERQQAESKRAMHPGFGNITREEWNDFHLRHAELHMSFIANQG